MEIKDRLIEVIRHYNLNPTDFANAIGANRTTIQHILSGRNDVSLKIITGTDKAFPNVSLRWLIYGEGPAFLSPTHSQQMDLFENNENSNFPAKVQTSFKFQNPENDIKEVEKPQSLKTEGHNIKEVVIFYEDGTFEKYSKQL